MVLIQNLFFFNSKLFFLFSSYVLFTLAGCFRAASAIEIKSHKIQKSAFRIVEVRVNYRACSAGPWSRINRRGLTVGDGGGETQSERDCLVSERRTRKRLVQSSGLTLGRGRM